MENLLPILLGILFLGIKYYNKTQKDKAKRNFQQPVFDKPEEEYSPSLNTFIKQFYQEEQGFSQEPALATVATEKDEIQSWKEQMHEQEPSSIEYTDERQKKSRSTSQFETIQNKPSQKTETLDFDLRKAILYDAIINPPYI